ncbi:hypothetical protein BP00DRAFT_446390 [Aspergillus indologenus CBS 114.80]|uniref:Uncharacterized protein n=1 Tax=Aspergillus indologenus CBS 114.80 TaxID=1450541 RepID=A0A2V5I445_9EURO|nr:hypothetical protein BP00DRAFT_446390 [Aspergillus indologenus CBS 114.80]
MEEPIDREAIRRGKQRQIEVTPEEPPRPSFEQRLSRTARILQASTSSASITTAITSSSTHGRSVSFSIPQATVECDTFESHDSDSAIGASLTDAELLKMIKRKPAIRKEHSRYFTTRGYLRKQYWRFIFATKPDGTFVYSEQDLISNIGGDYQKRYMGFLNPASYNVSILQREKY